MRSFAYGAIALLLFGAVSAEPEKGREWGQGIVLGNTFDCGAFRAITRDGTGRIWALCRGYPKGAVTLPNGAPAFSTRPPQESAWLITLEQDTWRIAALGDNFEIGNLSAPQFFPGPDGSQFFLDLSGELVQLCGLRGRCIPSPSRTASLTPNHIEVFRDSKMAAWLLTGDSKAFLLHPQQAKSLMSYPAGSALGDAIIRVVAGSRIPKMAPSDGWGRIWIPMKELTDTDRSAGLRNTLILDPQPDQHLLPQTMSRPDCDSFEFAIADPSGIRLTSDGPVAPCTAPFKSIGFTRKDDATMLCGLTDIDISTMRVRRQTITEDSLAGLRTLRSQNDTWYAFTPKKIWRYREDAWNEVSFPGAELVETSKAVTPIVNLVAVGSDVWAVTNYKPSLWYVPEERDEAVPLDWRRGLPFSSIEGIAPYGNDKVLLLGGEIRGSVIRPAARLKAMVTEPLVLETLSTKTRLLQDDAYRLYTLSSGDTPALSRWDGAEWRDLPVPSSTSGARVSCLAIDSASRIWALPEQVQQPVSVFDSHSDTWHVYDSFGAALEHSATEEIHLVEYTDPGRTPVHGPDGRLAYYTSEQVYAFEGRAWKSWSIRKDIFAEGNVFDRACFYSKEGRLRVGTWKETWECGDDGQWHSIPFAPGAGSWKELIKPAPRETPAAIKNHLLQTPAIPDRLGRTWNLWSGRLFRSGYDVCANVFHDERFAALDSLPPLDAALIDPTGNCFLHYEKDGHHYLKVSLQESKPETVAKSQELSATGVTLTMEPPREGSFLTVRVDDGPWTKALSETIVTPHLPAGKHRIEVSAVTSDDLRADPTPLVVRFDTTAVKDSEAPPITQWIADLRSTDYEKRKTAVHNLSQRPAESLPALREARDASLDDDYRWWLDSAIQRVLEASGQNNK
ncbi:MAG: hypothetical protein HZB26_06710 [Candidatus Hydrogenedentes bacterium]|nr:hypothetical protein [Candidatus Hydrogenedentota bacterium]